MPTFQEIEKEEIIRAHGLDPAVMDLSDDYKMFVPKRPTTPVSPSVTSGLGISNIPKLQPEPPTPAQTFKSTFAHQALPTLAGGAAAGLTLRGLGAAIPPIGPWGLGLKGLLMLAGSVASGYGAARAVGETQDVITSDEYKQRLAESQATNPTAALLGGLSTIPLGGFRPSFDALRSVGGAAKLATGLSLTPIEKAAMLNTGINTALQPAIEIAAAQAEGRPMPGLGELALSGVTGSIFTRPWALGRAMGFPTEQTYRGPEMPGLDKMMTVEQEQALVNQIMQDAAASEALSRGVTIRPEDIIQNPAEGRGRLFDKGTKTVEGKTRKKEEYVPFKSAEDSALEMKRLLEAEETEQNRVYEAELQAAQQEQQRQKTMPLSQRNKEIARLRREAKYELPPGYVYSTESRFAKSPTREQINQQIQQRIAQNLPIDDLVAQRDKLLKPTAQQEPPNLRHLSIALSKLREGFPEAQIVDVTKRNMRITDSPESTIDELLNKFGVEKFGKEGEQIVYDPLVYEDSVSGMLPGDGGIVISHGLRKGSEIISRPLIKPSERYSEDFRLSEPTTELSRNTAEQLRARGYSARLTPEWYEAFQQFAPRRGVEMVTDTSMPQAGAAQIRKGVETVLARINPNKAAIDTPLHEIAHPFKQDMAREEAPLKDQKFAKRYDMFTERNPEFIRINKERQEQGLPKWDVEEFQVSEAGIEGIAKQLRTDGQFRTFYRDMLAHIKTRYSPERASDADFRRIFQYKMENDPAFSEMFRGVTPAPVEAEAVERESTESPIQSNDDSARYNAAQARMKELLAKGEFDTQEFRDAWQEAENIKNKNKGMPPVAERQQPESPLSPQDERSLRLGKKQEGRTPYPFTEKERVVGERAIKDTFEEAVESVEQDADLGAEQSEASRKKIAQADELGPLIYPDSVDGLERNQPSSPLSETDPSAKSLLPGLASAFDKVEQKVSAPIAQAGRNWFARKDQYTGKLLVALDDLDALPDVAADEAMRKMRSVFRGEVPNLPNMTAEQRKAQKVLQDYFTWNVEERRRNGQLIEGREAGKNPNYVPDVMNERTRHILLETPNSPEAKQLRKVWIDYVMQEAGGKLSREEVANNIVSYLDAIGSPSEHYTSINFGAVRKAQGYGLPKGMRETSAKKALLSYGRRSANDMAFYKEIESQPDIAGPLMLRDPKTGQLPPRTEDSPSFHTTKEVKNMMAWVTGKVNENSIKHPFITSAARLTNNLLLGAPTGLRDLAQVPVFNVPYMNKWSDLSAFARGVLNFRAESRNALQTAARQPQIDKIMLNDIKESPNRWLSAIQKAATLARKGQFRELLENTSRDISFSIGKEFARGNIAGARAGHDPSKKFLQRFGTLVEGDVTKMKGAELENALNQIAKNVVDATQGTYGPAGLPNFTTEGQAAPFLALTKWSIEKSNTIFKDVIKPFYTGENRIPMLTYTLGSVLTGAGIQLLNEALSGKKGTDPTWKEAIDKGDAEAYTMQLATLMQLGTYGGIIGDAVKIAADAYKGKQPRNPLSFPLYSSTLNSAEMIADAFGAMQEGEDPFTILYRLSLDLMANNVQNARVAISKLDEEETGRKKAYRDVRVFEELEGKRGTDIPRVNRYAGMESKEFKREKDLGKALEMIPGLLERITTEAESLEDLQMKLRRLKQNNYQTFPNPETQPEKFQKYYEFLVRTRGEEEAQQQVTDYFLQNEINRVKSELVPSL